MARLGVPPHVADKILNHQTGTISGVESGHCRAQLECLLSANIGHHWLLNTLRVSFPRSPPRRHGIGVFHCDKGQSGP
jgi:hypothetical protein